MTHFVPSQYIRVVFFYKGSRVPENKFSLTNLQQQVVENCTEPVRTMAALDWFYKFYLLKIKWYLIGQKISFLNNFPWFPLSFLLSTLENSVKSCLCFNIERWLSSQHNKLKHRPKLWINRICNTMGLKMTITMKTLPHPPHQLRPQRMSDNVRNVLETSDQRWGCWDKMSGL